MVLAGLHKYKVVMISLSLINNVFVQVVIEIVLFTFVIEVYKVFSVMLLMVDNTCEKTKIYIMHWWEYYRLHSHSHRTKSNIKVAVLFYSSRNWKFVQSQSFLMQKFCLHISGLLAGNFWRNLPSWMPHRETSSPVQVKI